MNTTIHITQYLQNDGGNRLSVSHNHNARDLFELRNHSWGDIPVNLDLPKNTWPSHKAGRHTHIENDTYTKGFSHSILNQTKEALKIKALIYLPVMFISPDHSTAIVISLRFSNDDVPG